MQLSNIIVAVLLGSVTGFTIPTSGRVTKIVSCRVSPLFDSKEGKNWVKDELDDAQATWNDTMDKAEDKGTRLKEDVKDSFDKAEDKGKQLKEDVKDSLDIKDEEEDETIWEQTKDLAGNAWDKTKGAASTVKDKTKSVASGTWEKAKDLVTGDDGDN